METLELEKEREYENDFYEKVKETWIKDKTKSNLDWVSQRMDRLNRVDQKITIRNQQNLPQPLLDIIDYLEESKKKWLVMEIQKINAQNELC